MIALAAFRRALALKLACSFPPPHTHALMRALAFTLHLSSPLSPPRTASSHAVSVVQVSGHSSTLFSSISSFLSSSHLHHLYFVTFQSHLSYRLHTFTPLASLHLLSSIFFCLPPSCLSLRSWFSLCIPLTPLPPVLLPPPVFVPPLSAGSYVCCSVKSASGAAIQA